MLSRDAASRGRTFVLCAYCLDMARKLKGDKCPLCSRGVVDLDTHVKDEHKALSKCLLCDGLVSDLAGHLRTEHKGDNSMRRRATSARAPRSKKANKARKTRKKSPAKPSSKEVQTDGISPSGRRAQAEHLQKREAKRRRQKSKTAQPANDSPKKNTSANASRRYRIRVHFKLRNRTSTKNAAGGMCEACQRFDPPTYFCNPVGGGKVELCLRCRNTFLNRSFKKIDAMERVASGGFGTGKRK